MRTILSLLAVILLLTSCQKYNKTKTGLAYKITSGGNKTKLKPGQVIKLAFEYKVGGKDTILRTTKGGMPGFAVVDTTAGRIIPHSFMEVLTQCAPGDKLEVVMSIDTLKRLGQIQEYNDLFKRGGTITGKIEILKAYASEADAQADFTKEVEADRKRKMEENNKANAATKSKEVAELQKYATAKGIKTVQSPMGVLVQVENAGEAVKAEPGTTVHIFYKGYLMDGKEFDSNIGKQPAVFPVGNGTVISGWDDALRFFGKGGKGKLLVPATLAYGQDGRPPVIPGNSNLIFDIEVVEVEAAKNPAP